MPTNFDEKAPTWDDDPTKVGRARVVAGVIRSALPERRLRHLLEYGAGTGLVSQALADRVDQITLADPSAGMREVMAGKVAAGAFPPDTRVWDLDLASGDVPDERFDLIVAVLVLHHIHDVDTVLRSFAGLLADGGHLCLVDLEAEDGSFHRDDPGFDAHHGFRPADLEGQLHAAGFGSVRFEPCHELEKEGRLYPLFLATCTAGSS